MTFTFDHKEENVYVADKSGDVYRYSLSDQAAEDKDDGNQILGHVSMLLDAVSRIHFGVSSPGIFNFFLR